MKLAPPQNTLQPLPPNVQPAVSQSVQRTATQVDIQTIQDVQAAQQSSDSSQQPVILPSTMFSPAASANSIVLWIGIAIAVIIAAGGIWLWRSF